MLNQRTEIISKWRHRNKYTLAIYDSMDWNIICKGSWNYWNFWSLWQPDVLYWWSRLSEASSISINFKIRCDLCNVYSTHVFTIIHVNKVKVKRVTGIFQHLCCDVIKNNKPLYCSTFDRCYLFGWRLLRKQPETLSYGKSSTLYRFTWALY